jgi:septum formation protein
MTTSSSPTLILASASPRRREILSALGVKFGIDPSRVPEPLRRSRESPGAFAARSARTKARDVARRHSKGLVIAADTIVVLGTRIFGKPRSKQEARGMLRDLQGRLHEVVTGLCLLDCRTGKMRVSRVTSRVHLRRMKHEEIEWYLSTGEYIDKAGAYGIQGFASLFIDRIEGCYFNIVGFPVSAFERETRALGWRLFR